MDDPAYRRLRWRCHRGMLELDLVLQGFLDQHHGTLTPAELDEFKALLECPDHALFTWLNGTVPVTDDGLKQIVRKIRQHADYRDK